jgi:hypothetical protein
MIKDGRYKFIFDAPIMIAYVVSAVYSLTCRHQQQRVGSGRYKEFRFLILLIIIVIIYVSWSSATC